VLVFVFRLFFLI